VFGSVLLLFSIECSAEQMVTGLAAAWQGVGSIGSVKKVEVAGTAPANVRLASPEGTTQWAAATPVVETPAGQLAAKQDAALAAVLAPKDPALPQNNGNGTDPVAGAPLAGGRDLRQHLHKLRRGVAAEPDAAAAAILPHHAVQRPSGALVLRTHQR
jgi:hypothetical protein